MKKEYQWKVYDHPTPAVPAEELPVAVFHSAESVADYMRALERLTFYQHTSRVLRFPAPFGAEDTRTYSVVKVRRT